MSEQHTDRQDAPQTLGPDDPPSPPGRYWWGGRHRRYDFGRIAARLGRASDVDLAREITCLRGNVQALRRRLGIPAFRKLDEVEPYLGRHPDLRLAREFGVSAAGVRKRRKARGIPKADRKQAIADAEIQAYVRNLERQEY